MTNADKIQDIAREIQDQADEMYDMMERTKELLRKAESLGAHIHMASLEAYVFGAIGEHLSNHNRYNQSYQTIVDDLFEQAESLQEESQEVSST